MRGFMVLLTIFLVIYQAGSSIAAELEDPQTQIHPDSLDTAGVGEATPDDRQKRSAIETNWRKNFDVNVDCPVGNCDVDQSSVYPCLGGLCGHSTRLLTNRRQGCSGLSCLMKRRNFDIDVKCPGGNCNVNQGPVYPCYGGLCGHTTGLHANGRQGCAGPGCLSKRRNFDIDVTCPGGNCNVNQGPVYPCYGGLCGHTTGLGDNRRNGCSGANCMKRRNFDIDVTCPGGNCNVNQGPVYQRCHGVNCWRTNLSPCIGEKCLGGSKILSSFLSSSRLLQDNPDVIVQNKIMDINGPCSGGDCVGQKSRCAGGDCRVKRSISGLRRNFDIDVTCPGGNCNVKQTPVYPCYGGLCGHSTEFAPIYPCSGANCMKRRNFDIDVTCPGGNCNVNQGSVYPCHGGLCGHSTGLHANGRQGCAGPGCLSKRRNFDIDVTCPGGNCNVNQGSVYPCHGGLCGHSTGLGDNRRNGCSGANCMKRRNFDIDVTCPGGNCNVNQGSVYLCHGGLCGHSTGLHANGRQGCAGPGCLSKRRNFDIDVTCPGGNCNVNQGSVYPCHGGLCGQSTGLHVNRRLGCVGGNCRRSGCAGGAC